MEYLKDGTSPLQSLIGKVFGTFLTLMYLQTQSCMNTDPRYASSDRDAQNLLI